MSVITKSNANSSKSTTKAAGNSATASSDANDEKYVKKYEKLSIANDKVAVWLDEQKPALVEKEGKKVPETANEFYARLKGLFHAKFHSQSGGGELSKEAIACIELLLDNSSPQAIDKQAFKAEPTVVVNADGTEVGVSAVNYRNNLNRAVVRDEKGKPILGKDGRPQINLDDAKFQTVLRKYQADHGLSDEQLKLYFPIIRVGVNSRGKLAMIG